MDDQALPLQRPSPRNSQHSRSSQDRQPFLSESEDGENESPGGQHIPPGPDDQHDSQLNLPARDYENDSTDIGATSLQTDQENASPDDTKIASQLHRSRHALHIFAIYAVLALFTWICTCVMSFRPLTISNYGDDYGAAMKQADPYDSHGPYVKNENLYQAIRIFQAIVAVITLPATSAICVEAAVIFVQRNKRNRTTELSLRQMMVLADKGWTDMATWRSICGGWRRFVSSFFAIAAFLHLLGGILSPLQQYFVDLETIKTPTGTQTISSICDIRDHFPDGSYSLDVYLNNDNSLTALTRSALMSSSSSDVQSRLWQVNPASCNMLNHTTDFSYDPICIRGGATLEHLQTLDYPFLSQLPSGYNTGLIKQYSPRINSTAIVEDVSEEAGILYNCQEGDENFYVTYSIPSFNLTACMPGDQSKPIWRNTRDRQDFVELLYLNISTSTTWDSAISSTRITLNTTAGFFELPSYKNVVPGPLLDEDPLTEGDGYTDRLFKSISKRQATNVSSARWTLESVPNKGALITLAMALFGRNSFLANRAFSPRNYVSPPGFLNWTKEHQRTDVDNCQEVVPFARLLQDQGNAWDQFDPYGQFAPWCIKNQNLDVGDVYSQLYDYVKMFQTDNTVLSNALTAAAFLYNELWLTNPPVGAAVDCSIKINYDLGADTQKPSVSLVGIVVISFLLAVFLLGLFLIALYSYRSPRWTSQLNSFAMMRIGATIANEVPLMVANDTSELETLDRLPGVVGEVEVNKDAVGEIGLGAARPLSATRRYISYDFPVAVLDAERKEQFERTKPSLADYPFRRRAS